MHRTDPSRRLPSVVAAWHVAMNTYRLQIIFCNPASCMLLYRRDLKIRRATLHLTICQWMLNTGYFHLPLSNMTRKDLFRYVLLFVTHMKHDRRNVLYEIGTLQYDPSRVLNAWQLSYLVHIIPFCIQGQNATSICSLQVDARM